GPAFAAANLREQSLEAIWRDSQTFRAIRALPGGTTETFSGGCRARALTFHRSVNAPRSRSQEEERRAPRGGGAGPASPARALGHRGGHAAPDRRPAMIPEWLYTACDPNEDAEPYVRLAQELKAQGALDAAATAYDRAFGLVPDDAEVAEARRRLLDRLAVVEHGILFRYF